MKDFITKFVFLSLVVGLLLMFGYCLLQAFHGLEGLMAHNQMIEEMQ